MVLQWALMSSGVISLSSRLRHCGSTSRLKIDRRMLRVLSAIGAFSIHPWATWAKLCASFSRRLARCFSSAGETPSAIRRLASISFSRALARDSPAGP